MVEIRGDKKVLVTPVSAEDLKDIKIGDIVWLDGDLMTCRDVAHRRLVEYGRELPYDIKDKAIFHAGPVSYTHLDVYKRQVLEAVLNSVKVKA